MLRAEGSLIYGPDGLVAEVGFGKRDDPEMNSLAILFAAAPEMLSILETLVSSFLEVHRRKGSKLEIYLGSPNFCAIVEAAAKARGR